MRPGPVLIVEDDDAVQAVFTLALSDTYDVRHATTATQALAMVQSEPVAAMVLDYRLPDRTGLELLNEIRSAARRVPIIMVTGYGSEWVCTSAFRLGVVDYFPKPVNIFELSQSVRRAVARSSADAAAPVDARIDEDPPAAPDPAPHYPDLPIQKAIELIQHRYWDTLSLARLARETGMSKYRLSHRFTQVMGVSLREYLLKVRLERAKDLLAAGRQSITEVAQAVGFGDLPRFDKLFRRYTGLTPSAYRSRTLPRARKTDNPARRRRGSRRSALPREGTALPDDSSADF